jgi:hypothetical protein
MVVKPWNFSWRFAEYTDPNQDLILSDLDILRKRKFPDPEITVKPVKIFVVIDFFTK